MTTTARPVCTVSPIAAASLIAGAPFAAAADGQSCPPLRAMARSAARQSGVALQNYLQEESLAAGALQEVSFNSHDMKATIVPALDSEYELCVTLFIEFQNKFPGGFAWQLNG